MTCLAHAACELIQLPAKPATVLLRDIGGRERASMSVRVAVSLLTHPANAVAQVADAESLLEEPERWDGLS